MTDKEPIPWYEDKAAVVEKVVFPFLLIVALGLMAAASVHLFDLIMAIQKEKENGLTALEASIGGLGIAGIWTSFRYFRNDLIEHRLREGHAQEEYFQYYLTKTSLVIDFAIGWLLSQFFLLFI